MRDSFINWRFQTASRVILTKVQRIVGEEDALPDGPWTLRQINAVLVDEGVLRDTASDYERLGEVVLKARLSGELDWDAISDGPPRHLGELTDQQDPELWIEREVVALQVFEAARVWGLPVVYLRGAPSIDSIYRLHKRGGRVIHIADPGSKIDLARRLEVFDPEGDQEVLREIEPLDELHPDELRAYISDLLIGVLGAPGPGEMVETYRTLDEQRHAKREWELPSLIEAAMAETADTTRASALKKKIEVILHG